MKLQSAIVPLAPCPLPRSVDHFGIDWRGRRVLVVGLGKSGVAAAALLRQIGCRVRLTERGENEALRGQARDLFACGVERLELGGHSREVCDGADAVVVSPGVPESAEPLLWASSS